MKRSITEKQRTSLRTLLNNMLYLNFKAKLERLNPDRDIEQLINRDLEPQEAIGDMRKRYPDLVFFEHSECNYNDEFREYLNNLGITNNKQQDLVISKAD